MKPEDAKKYLKFYAGDGLMKYVLTPIRTEALISAIDALKYRVPKKPHKIHDVDENGHPYYAYVCDECGGVIDETKDECGQAIDWEEEE